MSVIFLVLLAVTAASVYSLQQNRIDKLQSQVNSLNTQQSQESNKLAGSIQSGKFQAVFVNVPGSTGGQVYFGHLSFVDSSDYKLTDIYYLSSSGSSLVKLGNEPHKPQDAMFIPKTSVIFWENLKDANQFSGQLK
ncbi:MAG TPA: hypothetical protein VGG13_00685 [Candidatus Saccharimonadales bacterium]